jgi:hypothetical protein
MAHIRAKGTHNEENTEVGGTTSSGWSEHIPDIRSNGWNKSETAIIQLFHRCISGCIVFRPVNQHLLVAE